MVGKDALVTPSEIHLIGRMEDHLSHIDEVLPRERWTNNKILRDFARRNISQMEKDNNSFFMNPCSDLSSYLLYLLSFDREINKPRLGAAEEINSYGFPSIHNYVLLEYHGETYLMDFSSHNEVLLRKGGEYRNPNPEVKTLNTYVFHEPFQPEKNIIENYGDYFKRFRFFDLDMIINKLVKDNHLDEFLDYKERMKGKENLYLKYMG
ncbi:MAG: hypothetical protein ACQEP1_04500 [Nanobdellota archaeon]